jgi:hypothetical protein
MKNNNAALGIILLVIGGILLYNNIFHTNLLSMAYMWPMFVLGPGLVFEFNYFTTKKAPGLLVPGGILTSLGLLFFFETFTHWRFSDVTWPFYPLAVAVGLFQLYLFSGRPKGLLIPVGILTAVGGSSFAIIFINKFTSFAANNLYLPVILIILGIFFIFAKPEKKGEF